MFAWLDRYGGCTVNLIFSSCFVVYIVACFSVMACLHSFWPFSSGVEYDSFSRSTWVFFCKLTITCQASIKMRNCGLLIVFRYPLKQKIDFTCSGNSKTSNSEWCLDWCFFYNRVCHREIFCWYGMTIFQFEYVLPSSKASLSFV